MGQSNGSIERQELYTDHWLKVNAVELVDTFIDRGKSARTFDLPDFKKLQKFIARHFKHVDYLLLDQLDRFSRDAGEAMSMVKNLQKKYSIQVVSVTEGITFDHETPDSFFRAGLQLLLAEEDNINRSIKVKGGLYTAKAKEGRFVYKNAPFGYRKQGERKERKLIVEKCHCGNPLSGAPSGNKSGKYFYYYKCRLPKHNNISAIKAHDQFLNACGLMSLPPARIKQAREGCELVIQKELQTNKAKISEKTSRLEQVQQILFSVEEKWIKNEINRKLMKDGIPTSTQKLLV